ncbi:MAG: hypothetical protein ACREBR_04760 [bacterium]
MNKENDEELLCDMCGEPEAETCLDPYTMDIEGEEIEINLCEECYQIRCDDI